MGKDAPTKRADAPEEPSLPSTCTAPCCATETNKEDTTGQGRKNADPHSSENPCRSVLFCDAISDWQHLAKEPDCEGMCKKRPLDPTHYQHVTDALSSEVGRRKKLRLGGESRAYITRDELKFGSETPKEVFRETAARILAPFCDGEDDETNSAANAIPPELCDTILDDVASIGEQLLQLLPKAEKFGVALELMGENVCRLWHVDNYLGRAIVTYNCAATEYTDISNVDMWELENCGNNDHRVRDSAKSSQVRVGDILFMKGGAFAEGSPGLVHKSPTPLQRPDGSYVQRLCLKVDAPTY